MAKDMVRVVAAAFHRQDADNGLQLAFFRRANQESAVSNGFWEFPGGKVEAGESDQQALVREIDEELGASIKVQEFIGENIHEYPNKKVALNLYTVVLDGPENFVLVDHDLWGWFSIEQIKQLKLAPADIPLLPKLIAHFCKTR